jgi:DNA-binding NarL/FixJ family response regulator
MTARRIRILCVDDHPLMREGIELRLSREPDMEVVAAAATGEQAVKLVSELQPDITLMDLQLPGMSGLAAIRAIRTANPDARVIVLTMYQGDEDVYRALEAGAITYLSKDTVSEDLVRVVRQVDAGDRPVPPEIASILADRDAKSPLTAREVETLTLMAKGHTNGEIAAHLGISKETAKVYVHRILLKLEVNDRTAAVSVGLKRGIIHL